MKRFFSLIFVALLSLFLLPGGVRAEAAEDSYAVAADPDIWFYAAASESSRLFLVPYTYYVKVLELGDKYTRVEYLTDDAPYQRIEGYCLTDELLFVDFTPSRPYLKRQITLSYSLPQAGGLGSGAFGKVEKTFVYYGHRYDGAQLYFYVLSEGTFDYISAEEELTFDFNTDYLDYLERVNGVTDTPTPSVPTGGLSAAEIVVICVACVAAVVIAVFVLRGKKPPVPEPEQAEF